jgi:voltage-gated potassium channel
MAATRLLYALILLFLILAIGIFGYHFIEQLSFLDAFYMTLITISTVGFREVKELSQAGRIFTMFLIVTGIGILFYTVSAAVEFMLEGYLGGVLEERRKRKSLAKLKKHYIICGFGRVGRQVALELLQRKAPCVVIEKDLKRAQEASDEGFLCLQGEAADEEVLNKARIAKAEGLVAAVDTDADNVFVTLTARQLNPDLLIIARANTEESEGRLRKAGADHVISPTVIGGRRIARLLLKPLVCDYLDELTLEEGGEFELDEVEISQRSPLVNLSIKEAGLREKAGALILAIRKAEGRLLTNPGPHISLEAGDKVILLGTPEQLKKASSILG